MKIQSIQGYNLTNRNQSKNNYQSAPIISLSSNGDQKAHSLSFKSSASRKVAADWTLSGINIFGRNENQLIDLAESFHKASYKVINAISEQQKWGGWWKGNIRDEVTSQKAYQRISTAIEEVIKRKANASSYEVWRLDEKAKKCYKQYTLWNLDIEKGDVCP